MSTQEYDVLIVGGGPAGLSAALMLGRCNRRVLLVDSMEYRNEASLASHGFLTRDGTPPSQLRSIGREELTQYPVTFRAERVTSVTPAFEKFAVQMAHGATALVRKVILATGITDTPIPIQGMAEIYGKSAFPCPYCDAWEVRGEPLGVIGKDGAGLAMMMLTWSRDVMYFANGAPINPAEEARLREVGIPTIRPAIQRLESAGGILSRVWLAGGGYTPRRALFLKSGLQQRSDLTVQLGLRDPSSDVIRHSSNGATSIPGLYIAGDITQDSFFVISAAAEGTRAAVAVNEEIHHEDMMRRQGWLKTESRGGA